MKKGWGRRKGPGGEGEKKKQNGENPLVELLNENAAWICYRVPPPPQSRCASGEVSCQG